MNFKKKKLHIDGIKIQTYVNNSQAENNEAHNGMNVVGVNFELGVALAVDKGKNDREAGETHTDAHEDTVKLEPHSFTQ